MKMNIFALLFQLSPFQNRHLRVSTGGSAVSAETLGETRSQHFSAVSAP